MIFIAALIGKEINGRWAGILINERNKMALSRFQLVIWTFIVISAFLTMVLQRIVANVADPIDITLPEQLWALLGISTTSLVGTPLVQGTKTKKKPADVITKEEKELCAQEIKQRVEERYGSTSLPAAQQEIEEEKKKIDDYIDSRNERFGILAANETVDKAKFSDMFKGDEQGNKDHIDMAKVQKFFFTLIIAFSYMVLLFNLILTADPAAGLNNYLASFPELSDGVVALLGISAAGFLVNKAPDHTKTRQ